MQSCGLSAAADDGKQCTANRGFVDQTTTFKKVGQMASASQLGATPMFPATIFEHTPTYPCRPPAPRPLINRIAPPFLPRPQGWLLQPLNYADHPKLLLSLPASAGMGLQHRPQQVHPCAREVLHLARALVHGKRRLQPRASTAQQQQGARYFQSMTRLWRPADPAVAQRCKVAVL